MALTSASILRAAPILPLFRARIARTPRARLSIIYVLTGQLVRCWQRTRPTAPLPVAAPGPEAVRFRQGARGALSVGELMYLERLVTGGIVGTRLDLLSRETEMIDCFERGDVIDLVA